MAHHRNCRCFRRSLFGAKKLPDSAKSVAKSLRIFKDELKTPEDKKGEGDSSSKSSD